MNKHVSRFVQASAVLSSLMMLSGCQTTSDKVKPMSKPYTFITQSYEYRRIADQLTTSAMAEEEEMVRVAFTNPDGSVVKFYKNKTPVDLASGEEQIFKFRGGVYPFEVVTDGETELTGAMMFYNIDKAASYATFGIGENSPVILDENLLNQAREGRLGKYTMQFDGRDVMTYWVGNRTELYVGKKDTLEIDFSGTEGISGLRIDKKEQDCLVKTFGLYEARADGTTSRKPAEYAVEFSVGDKKFRGYLHNLKFNEFTAFVQIPCAIPKDLLHAASQGTVSKFLIICGDEGSKTAVAELVISRG